MIPVSVILEWRDGTFSSQVLYVRSRWSAAIEVYGRYGYTSAIVGLLAYMGDLCVGCWGSAEK